MESVPIKSSFQEEAKNLLELMREYHAGDHEPSEFKQRKVLSALRRLEERGLIARRSRAEVGDFVLRDAVHGSPLLIFMAPSAGIVFTSLFFARCCRDFLNEKNIQILKVIS